MNLILQLVTLIEENLNSELPVKTLASRSGYTERWLYSLFLEETGISVAQYIRRRKLTLASVLLRHTSRPVTDISLMYDFSSPQHFSRAFRKQFRVSPVKYRNADAWDMQFAQPVLYKTAQCTEFRMTEITEGNHPAVLLQKKSLHLGMDFVHVSSGGRFIYNRNLFKSIMAIYEPVSGISDFLITGEMVPSKEMDSELVYTIEKISRLSRPEKLLPDGLYASQKFTGTYEQIFDFQMYDSISALIDNKCILKREPMYTLFHRTDNKDIMNAQFLIPCVKPQLCHTR
ncbi:helix-turn-helix transcriptional regulator [Atlantibacter hermannii]|uniref:helix-turn-helix transcriptional regulator n=1 Tax=Atlantibacter hermannii TaxID=565 RepID=UPI00253F674F|nr:helix-turn-helix transcriptional regulator [Atlantibacter hermannii]WIF57209.1 helix-turn-helix transcriptional regulator [Atlantibacter hermannii]